MTKKEEELSTTLNASATPYLVGHKHETVPFRGDFNCDACDDRLYGDNIQCNICEFSLHNKCTFVFSVPEIHEHLSHDGHCLKLLTKGAPDHTDPKCHICGKYTKRLLYHCSTCNLNLDIDCMVSDMSARAMMNIPWHHHPLVKLDSGHQMLCEVCGHPNGYGYFCPTCKLMVHDKCVPVFDMPEITHPLHVTHSLKLLTQGAPSYTDPECHVCGKHTENFLYHCVICKFNLDMACANEDHRQHTVTPVVLSNLKVHEDTLTLVPRLISFVCDACGMKGDRSPYVSFQGGRLMFFHQNCANLPRVIHVNRHDHRVSYKYPLGPGEMNCEICLKDIDWSHGAYSCSLCPNYAFHSRCATRKDVWDGEELDGVPEDVLDSEPFKLNDDNTITHFAHEQHNMSFNKDRIALEESILCEACVRPIASNTFYCCSVCNFILHETCANLPKTKRHAISPRLLSLVFISGNTEASCCACSQVCCNGFMYADGDWRYDLVCCSITVPFIHGSHSHPLVYLDNLDGIEELKRCTNCGLTGNILGCVKCNYYLDFCCATLPSTVRLQRYDDHPLTLCYGEEEASGKYWCDICERETDPETWFYTCNDCSVTVHIFCVLGDMIRYAKPRVKIHGSKELILNNTSTRPICNNCHGRCPGLFYFLAEDNAFCSFFCYFYSFTVLIHFHEFYTRPPWVDDSKLKDAMLEYKTQLFAYIDR